MKKLEDYFSDHSSLRAVIDAGLEGLAGNIILPGPHPGAVRLDLGCYSVLGGDPDSKDARHLIKDTAPKQEMVFAGPAWKARIQSLSPKAVEAAMITFLPGPDLQESAGRQIDALAPGFSLKPLTPAQPLNRRLTPNGFQVHNSAAGFFKHGFGFVVMHEGLMTALASTYCCSQDKAEIAISTDPTFRGKGFATSLACATVLECYRRGLEPHWSASNPISQRLARRVGFVDSDVCTYFKKP